MPIYDVFKLTFWQKLLWVIFGTGILVKLNNLNNVLELAQKKIWPNIRQLPTIFRFLRILQPQVIIGIYPFELQKVIKLHRLMNFI